MIDAYLHHNCPLGKNKDNPYCNICVWMDTEIPRCIFAVKFNKQVTLFEMLERMLKVDPWQQDETIGASPRFMISGTVESIHDFEKLIFSELSKNCRHVIIDNHKIKNCSFHDSSIGYCIYDNCPITGGLLRRTIFH